MDGQDLAMTGSKAATEIGQVEQQLDRMRKVADSIETRVEDLESRIGVVLMPPTEEPKGDAPATPHRVQLAEILDGLNDRFERQSDRLSQMFGRVQL